MPPRLLTLHSIVSIRSQQTMLLSDHVLVTQRGLGCPGKKGKEEVVAPEKYPQRSLRDLVF